MPNAIRFLSLVVSLGLSARVDVVEAQSPIPIHELSAPDAKSTDHFGTILGVRPLADGKLLVNDGQRRQLSILDEKLGARTVAIDSVALGGQSYGAYPAPIIPYLGDSTLFVDVASLSLVVINPDGAVTRVMAAPKPADLRVLGYRASGVDAKGSLVYQANLRPAITQSVNADHTVIIPFDSTPIVRANFETRTVDTIARVKVGTGTQLRSDTENGRTVTTMTFSPLSTVDDWAVLSDGTVMLIRGHDYHADLIAPDGNIITGKKLPFDWKGLTDADKQHLVDSTKDALAKRRAELKAQPANAPSPSPVPLPPPGGFTVIGVPPSSSGAVNTYSLVEDVVPLKQIPDYWPPIRLNAARADLDNNVWILPTSSAQSKNGELIYDVVNNRGEMTERVRIPAGKSIAGFGKNGIVYLMSKDADGWTIERAHVVRGKGNSLTNSPTLLHTIHI